MENLTANQKAIAALAAIVQTLATSAGLTTQANEAAAIAAAYAAANLTQEPPDPDAF